MDPPPADPTDNQPPDPSDLCPLCGVGICDERCKHCGKPCHKQCSKDNTTRLNSEQGWLHHCSKDCRRDHKEAIDERKRKNDPADAEFIGPCDRDPGECENPHQRHWQCNGPGCTKRIHSGCFSLAVYSLGVPNENYRYCGPGCMIRAGFPGASPQHFLLDCCCAIGCNC